jgi:hypothetical protein
MVDQCTSENLCTDLVLIVAFLATYEAEQLHIPYHAHNPQRLLPFSVLVHPLQVTLLFL